MNKLLLILFLAASVGAQTANVIELDPADAARAQKAWDAKQRADAEWDALRAQIQRKYADPQDRILIPDHSQIGPFINGFEFSKDFRFIVPKVPASNGLGYNGIPNCPNLYVTPATPTGGWGWSSGNCGVISGGSPYCY